MNQNLIEAEKELQKILEEVEEEVRLEARFFALMLAFIAVGASVFSTNILMTLGAVVCTFMASRFADEGSKDDAEYLLNLFNLLVVYLSFVWALLALSMVVR